MSRRKKVLIIASVLTILCAQLCAFTFDKTSVAIDTEKNRIYRYATAENIASAFALNEKAAEEKYKDTYILLSGKMKETNAKRERFVLIGEKDRGEIICSCPKTVQAEAKKYHVNDTMAVYGKLTIDVFDKEKHIAVEKIIPVPEGISSADTFFALDGTVFDLSASLERKLGGGRVSYHIPSAWKEVELNIKDNGLGTIEGYQYVLNKIPGSRDTVPESLFVCYFDKKLLKQVDDMSRLEAVEKVIIENIDGSVGKFPLRKDDTYYGAKYKYYLGRYTDALETGKGYHTEYVFQEDGKNGIVLFLYVYREERHISDVMFVTRFLEIGAP